MNNRTSDVNLIFSTPVWTTILKNHTEVNNKMHAYIQNLKSNNPKGVIRSNLLGWHSKGFDLKEHGIKFFIDAIFPIINESLIDMGWDLKKNEIKITEMWSIINPKNTSNSRHIHGNNFISAAYYVKAPLNSGAIVFYDPRSANVIQSPIINNKNKLNSTTFSVTPKEGLLVLFPSYLHHSVDINKSDQERIVISFNINLLRK